MSPYRNPDPPPRDREPSRLLAWLREWHVPIIGASTALALLCGILYAGCQRIEELDQRAHETCERLGTALGVPAVVESGSYCICANPETGRVERFSHDLYEREVIVMGMDARTREILGEPPPPRLLPSGAP